MTKEEFYKNWHHLLVDIGKSEADIAREVVKTTSSALNQKIKNATIRLLEFSEILEYYGYELKIVKKENN